MKKLLFLSLSCLIFAACGHRSSPAEAVSVVEMKMMAPPVVDEAAKNTIRDTSKKLIKDGDISFETPDIQQTRKVIIASLKKVDGYVSEENERNSNDENRKEYVLRTRIPSKNFELFLRDVSATAPEIDRKNITIRDVTTQFIDMSTRLNNKKLLEIRYLALLNKATRMADILQVEGKLDTIRSEIESEQGQLNYLNKQVAYSTLLITFYTKHTDPVDTGQGIGYQFKKSIGKGWDLLQDLFFGLVSIWPLVLGFILLVILFKKWRKRRKVAKAI